MEMLFHDLRYGIRMMLRKPGFTLIAVMALALGIGANTAIFSVVNAILLRPLPFADSERLVVPVSNNPGRDIDRGSISYADYLDWKTETHVFQYVAAFQTLSADLTGGDEPRRVSVAGVTEDYFSVMGVEALLGRTYRPEDYQPTTAATLILSYGLWQRQFGGDPDIIQQTILLNGRPYPVIGVMPKDSQWPETIEVWAPVAVGPNPEPDLLRRDNRVWRGVARLNPGVSAEQATAFMEANARRVEQDQPESFMKGWSAAAIPIHEYIVGPTLHRTLLVLFGAVSFVLLIACVNVANLLLARAATREREMAIRVALGAGRLRLIRQLLTENLLLALAGGAGGLLLALWGIDLLIRFAPDDIPRLAEVRIDGRALAFVVTVSLLTSLVFGMIPALLASKSDLNESLKEGGRGTAGAARGRRTRSVLVVSEIALSLVLLIGAGLMVRSFLRLQQVDPGLSVENLLTMEVNSPRARYKDNPQVADFYERLVGGITSAPGVESAAAATALPLGGGGFYLGRVFLIEGYPEPPAGDDHSAQWNSVTPDYFNTLGISLLRGRLFDQRDAAGANPVIIINETMARSMFPGEDALGKRIRSWRDENVLREIVGVVQDVRYFGRDDELRGLVYVPHRQDTWRSMSLTVRTSGDPAAFIGAIRDQIWSVDKDLAIANVRTMKAILDKSVAGQRFNMLLLTVFAVVALVLASVGIYGVLSYSVTQRSHEIGVRMALGAKTSDVLGLIVRQGIGLAVTGLTIGLVASLAVTRVMSSLLYEVSATDAVTFSAISLLLLAVAAAASYIPARRATKVDPMVALRYE